MGSIDPVRMSHKDGNVVFLGGYSDKCLSDIRLNRKEVELLHTRMDKPVNKEKPVELVARRKGQSRQ